MTEVLHPLEHGFSPLFCYEDSFYGNYLVYCDGVFAGSFDCLYEAEVFVGDEEFADDIAGVFHTYEIVEVEEF